ncbi:class I SAM-dependent methyltransferase [Marinobacterium sedimentorum]|uniref:class I SAM-dependent methyltransferase n=1 Tax=Marinobacterium sedimentorum TaxID=2927804 RepID=UPI0020C615B9|nr:class I SAM-dependent methyltransferase [Marinobacterium sedimentorum]MCP8688677.1 class I SAM-dependent methyltransferase [Marinobacterium sedimentorum]
MTSDFNTPKTFEQIFDQEIFGPVARALYADSGFYNLGYWNAELEPIPANMPVAARALAHRHLVSESPQDLLNVSSVLDVACGLGATTAVFERAYKNAQITGLGNSQQQLDAAAMRCPKARFLRMDAAKMDIPAQSMDRIHCVEAAFYFETRLDFLKRARSALRPGGRLVLTDILYRSGRGLHIPRHSVGMTQSNFLNEARQAGFIVRRFDDITEHTLEPFIKVVSELGRPLWGRLMRRAVRSYHLVELEPDQKKMGSV